MDDGTYTRPNIPVAPHHGVVGTTIDMENP